ncbi:MAG: LuxR C-terminal-related transcriptional regulator [Thermomicrobiales bacterium]
MEQLAWVVHRCESERASSEPPRWVEYEATLPASTGDLSVRELDVLELVATGRTDAEIADSLSISRRTVGAHISNMLNKTNASNRVELVIWALVNGVLMLTMRESLSTA